MPFKRKALLVKTFKRFRLNNLLLLIFLAAVLITAVAVVANKNSSFKIPGSAKEVECDQYNSCGSGYICKNGQCVSSNPSPKASTKPKTSPKPKVSPKPTSSPRSCRGEGADCWPSSKTICCDGFTCQFGVGGYAGYMCAR